MKTHRFAAVVGLACVLAVSIAVVAPDVANASDRSIYRLTTKGIVQWKKAEAKIVRALGRDHENKAIKRTKAVQKKLKKTLKAVKRAEASSAAGVKAKRFAVKAVKKLVAATKPTIKAIRAAARGNQAAAVRHLRRGDKLLRQAGKAALKVERLL